MSESEATKVDQLYEKLKGLPENDRDPFYYLIFARTAAALENQESGSERLAITVSKAWKEAAEYFNNLIESDPGNAFRLALHLTLLPKSDYPQAEAVYRWIRSDGPINLADERLRAKTLYYLGVGFKGDKLTEILKNNISFKIDDLTQKQAFHIPECFLAIASCYLGTRFKNNETNKNAKTLFELASEKLASRDVSKVVRYYQEYEDTAWIVEALEPFLYKEE